LGKGTSSDTKETAEPGTFTLGRLGVRVRVRVKVRFEG
jgi:hypothetical protein